MAWKTKDIDAFAKEIGVDVGIINSKLELIEKIKETRKKNCLTQEQLAKMIGKSQSFVAKVESGIGTRNFSFEALFKILNVLGYECKIKTQKAA